MKINWRNALISVAAVIFLNGAICAFCETQENLLFQEDFESKESVEANGGKVPAGVEFLKGKDGNAAYFQPGKYISFPTKGNFDLAEGTIEYWEQPFWPKNEKTFRYTAAGFFSRKVLSDKTLNAFLISHSGNAYGYEKEIGVRLLKGQTFGKRYPGQHLFGSCLNWLDGQWHKVTVSFRISGEQENRFMQLYLDEVLQDQVRGVPVSLFDVGEYIQFGDGRIALDSMRIYSKPKHYTQPAGRNFIINPGFEFDENRNKCPDFWGPVTGQPGRVIGEALPVSKVKKGDKTPGQRIKFFPESTLLKWKANNPV